MEQNEHTCKNATWVLVFAAGLAGAALAPPLAAGAPRAGAFPPRAAGPDAALAAGDGAGSGLACFSFHQSCPGK